MRWGREGGAKAVSVEAFTVKHPDDVPIPSHYIVVILKATWVIENVNSPSNGRDSKKISRSRRLKVVCLLLHSNSPMVNHGENDKRGVISSCSKWNILKLVLRHFYSLIYSLI